MSSKDPGVKTRGPNIETDSAPKGACRRGALIEAGRRRNLALARSFGEIAPALPAWAGSPRTMEVGVMSRAMRASFLVCAGVGLDWCAGHRRLAA